MKTKCPDCGSTQCIPWDDGFICCDCGTEFDEPRTVIDREELIFNRPEG